MPHPAPDEQLAKSLLKQLTTSFNQAREALAGHDFLGLAGYARTLQVLANTGNQTLIGVQARLLEQAAERGQLQQATKSLVKLKDAIIALRQSESELSLVPRRKPTLPPRITTPPQSVTRPFMPRPGDESFTKRLGNYLVDAELVTPAQIEVALADQRATGSRLGDILVARGWLKPGTIEFIMEKVVVPERTSRHPKASSEGTPVKSTTSPNNMNLDRATFIDQNRSTFLDMDELGGRR
ncbi:hypothetical protein RIF25_02925 [Thermosynechococcaceae cyanobacterium BACA0444]|uniref:Uncharacterized protein n=1 Tax=Pseudocalidococcus azoricus BACA0444 TaxID=2918990 RepID=A0AAE4JUX6_9CYAN|nr:hypothetical protein [Pseudocalidococcus azoricus]MDS3859755.1 hypothetical protein [Pseudocalidococcus azoricus BACA0444]